MHLIKSVGKKTVTKVFFTNVIYEVFTVTKKPNDQTEWQNCLQCAIVYPYGKKELKVIE